MLSVLNGFLVTSSPKAVWMKLQEQLAIRNLTSWGQIVAFVHNISYVNYFALCLNIPTFYTKPFPGNCKTECMIGYVDT